MGLLVLLGAAACGDKEEPEPPQSSCGEIPAAVEERFAAMRGPLGCEPTSSQVPDPPRGCAGADELLKQARREYLGLQREGGCAAVPDLSALVEAYQRDFVAQNAPVEHAIARDGYTISAREYGAVHAQDRPAIVLMHGFPDNQHLYDAVVPLLAKNHHTITFDFVGWGDSSKPEPDHVYTYDGLRADLEAVIAHFELDQLVPVVHDASGWPGIDWALDHPQSVSALVLLNTAYHPIEGQMPPYVIRALSSPDLRAAFIGAAGTDDLMTRALFRAQVGDFFSGDSQRQKYLPIFEYFAPAMRPGLFGLTETLLATVIARADDLPRMQSFPKPVSVIFGAGDPYLNSASAHGFAAAFPGSRLEVIEGADHYVQLDQPERVAELIGEAASPP